MPRLAFTFRPDGRVEVRVSDIKGPGCHALTVEAETLLGRAVTRARTPEYYQAQTQTSQRLRQESST